MKKYIALAFLLIGCGEDSTINGDSLLCGGNAPIGTWMGQPDFLNFYKDCKFQEVGLCNSIGTFTETGANSLSIDILGTQLDNDSSCLAKGSYNCTFVTADKTMYLECK
jgi:hypothetical protein